MSIQTVTRRYRTLRTQAGLRVVGLAASEKTGREQWIVRLTATPATARNLAQTLARRSDTSWVRLCSGGTEIIAIITTPSGAEGAPALLLHDVPRTNSVLAVSAHYLLHTYRGGPTGWPGRANALTEQQRQRLRPAPLPPAEPPHGDVAIPLAPDEQRLVDALGYDGRAGYRELAAATGWSPATTARRLTTLQEQGRLFFDVDIDDSQLGIGSRAMLWMAIAPARLDEVATTLADHHELAFVIATTGPSNLVAQALCPSTAALHDYLSRRLGTLPAIQSLETAPVLQTLKRSGALLPR